MCYIMCYVICYIICCIILKTEFDLFNNLIINREKKHSDPNDNIIY